MDWGLEGGGFDVAVLEASTVVGGVPVGAAGGGGGGVAGSHPVR